MHCLLVNNSRRTGSAELATRVERVSTNDTADAICLPASRQHCLGLVAEGCVARSGWRDARHLTRHADGRRLLAGCCFHATCSMQCCDAQSSRSIIQRHRHWSATVRQSSQAPQLSPHDQPAATCNTAAGPNNLCRGILAQDEAACCNGVLHLSWPCVIYTGTSGPYQRASAAGELGSWQNCMHVHASKSSHDMSVQPTRALSRAAHLR